MAMAHISWCARSMTGLFFLHALQLKIMVTPTKLDFICAYDQILDMGKIPFSDRSNQPMPRVMTLISDWIDNYQTLVWWMGLLSALIFIGFLVATPIIIIHLPSDFFHKRMAPLHENAHLSVFKICYLIVKNFFNAALVSVGIALIFLPGQGIFAIVIGVSLMNIPGKHKMMCRIVRTKWLMRSLNRFRFRFNKPAFIVNAANDPSYMCADEPPTP